MGYFSVKGTKGILNKVIAKRGEGKRNQSNTVGMAADVATVGARGVAQNWLKHQSSCWPVNPGLPGGKVPFQSQRFVRRKSDGWRRATDVNPTLLMQQLLEDEGGTNSCEFAYYCF